MIDKEIIIHRREYWFNIVDFLQKNWALIDEDAQGASTIFFVHDTSGVFDRIVFPSFYDAQTGLRKNGFRLYTEDLESQKFIVLPKNFLLESRFTQTDQFAHQGDSGNDYQRLLFFPVSP